MRSKVITKPKYLSGLKSKTVKAEILKTLKLAKLDSFIAIDNKVSFPSLVNVSNSFVPAIHKYNAGTLSKPLELHPKAMMVVNSILANASGESSDPKPIPDTKSGSLEEFHPAVWSSDYDGYHLNFMPSVNFGEGPLAKVSKKNKTDILSVEEGVPNTESVVSNLIDYFKKYKVRCEDLIKQINEAIDSEDFSAAAILLKDLKHDQASIVLRNWIVLKMHSDDAKEVALDPYMNNIIHEFFIATDNLINTLKTKIKINEDVMGRNFWANLKSGKLDFFNEIFYDHGDNYYKKAAFFPKKISIPEPMSTIIAEYKKDLPNLFGEKITTIKEMANNYPKEFDELYDPRNDQKVFFVRTFDTFKTVANKYGLLHPFVIYKDKSADKDLVFMLRDFEEFPHSSIMKVLDKVLGQNQHITPTVKGYVMKLKGTTTNATDIYVLQKVDGIWHDPPPPEQIKKIFKKLFDVEISLIKMVM